MESPPQPPTRKIWNEAPSFRKELSQSAIIRRQIMLDKQQEAKDEADKKIKRKRRFHSGFESVAQTFQKLNPGNWIDNLERAQDLADKLEEMNNEIIEEQQQLSICREAHEACFRAVREHLESFLEENPAGTYEEWIQELHPENASGKDDVDHRFYAEDSDHRILWNEHIVNHDGEVVRIHVPASIMQKIDEKGIKM